MYNGTFFKIMTLIWDNHQVDLDGFTKLHTANESKIPEVTLTQAS